MTAASSTLRTETPLTTGGVEHSVPAMAPRIGMPVMVRVGLGLIGSGVAVVIRLATGVAPQVIETPVVVATDVVLSTEVTKTL